MNILFLLLLVLDLPSLILSLRFNIPRADGPPSLGIRRVDFSQHVNGKSFRWYFFTSVVTYSENVQKLFPEEAQVAGLAYQAYDEAFALLVDDIHKIEGMNVLLVGNQAIFSSPLKVSYGSVKDAGVQKAPNFFYEIVPTTAAIRQQLLACSIADGRNGIEKHSTKGNCGEIVGMQIWLLQHPNTDWSKEAGARTTFVHKGEKTINPCKGRGNSHTWGCKQWAEDNGISWLDNVVLRSDAHISSEVPSEVVDIDTLWCEGWKERSENVSPSPLPSPSPTPTPTPTPSSTPAPPNNKRPASPSFDESDGYDSVGYEGVWDGLSEL